MTKQQARAIAERLGVHVELEAEYSVEDIVEMVSRINYGDGHATPQELEELAEAIRTLRANG